MASVLKAEWNDFLQSILDLLESRHAQNTFVRISTGDVVETLNRGSKYLVRKALLELASKKLVVLDTEERIQRVMLVSVEKRERTVSMAQNKPIHSQPGGKGKLYGRGRDGYYEGTYYYSDGSKKPDRHRFNGNLMKQREVVEKYDAWCKTLDDKYNAEIEERWHPKQEEAKTPKKEDKMPNTQEQEDKEMAAKGSAQVYQNTEVSNKTDNKIWVLVVQGKIINWFDNENSALNVASAMSVANKAAGITIEFDIQDVDKWNA